MINSLEALKEFMNEVRDKKPKLLLHSCCAPCASHIIELLSPYMDITIYFYNPNIHPQDEYLKRRDEFSKLGDYPFIEDEYNPKSYFDAVKGLEDLGERSKRCHECFKLRLDKTAKMAKEKNFDYFTTTLSISPYKDSLIINEIGNALAQEYGVNFLYSNFKKDDGYIKSLKLSKEYELYRQDYCGCIFSLEERKKTLLRIIS